MTNKISIILFFLINFLCLQGQVSVKIIEKTEEIDYAEIRNDLNSKIIDSLKYALNYASSLKEVIANAPNSYSREDVENMTLKELEQIINAMEEPLASIKYKMIMNKWGFLVINKCVVHEGLNRKTNSLHSETPYDFPIIIDYINEKKIDAFEEFLSLDVKFMKLLQCHKRLKYKYLKF